MVSLPTMACAWLSLVVAVPLLGAPPVAQPIERTQPTSITGDRVDPASFGPSVVEGMDVVLERASRLGWEQSINPKARNGEPGTWIVPSDVKPRGPITGNAYIVNKWGDTAMGIGFPEVVDVQGAYIFGQASSSVWTTGLKVVGYRDGQEVASTGRFTAISEKPHWFAMDLCGVDRIVIFAEAAVDQAGWYALDNLEFTIQSISDQGPTVLNFEDLAPRTSLAGSNYGGLTWERGLGQFLVKAIHRPMAPPGFDATRSASSVAGQEATASATNAIGPQVVNGFQGITLGSPGAGFVPPDTMGAVGPNHFVEVINLNMRVYDKVSGAQLLSVPLSSFYGTGSSLSDPRILFDQDSGRWITLVLDITQSSLRLAVSLNNDPLGSWFKTSFLAGQGIDAGNFPDYPTLGVDANGIYSGGFMVPRGTMTIFAIGKASLVSASPSLGPVTAFRGLPFEGAIQPAHSYSAAPGEYLVSVASSSLIRVRRIDPPLGAPTLTQIGFVSVPAHSNPPLATAQGGGTALDTIGDRLMMSVFRNGSLWTSHTVAAGSRAGCRWYELDPEALTLTQSGLVSDPILNFFFPSIMVNSSGDAAMGFSGSSPSQFASAYFTGRLATDPPGEMAVPGLLKAGENFYQILDGNGRNRWGDYSYTTLDPADDFTFWTIQEFATTGNRWATWIAELLPSPCRPATTRAMGSQTFAVTPPAGVDPVAMRVVGDPTDSAIACFDQFIQADGTLGTTPVTMLPVDWGEVIVHGGDILPSREYRVVVECPSFVSGIATVNTKLWGDIVADNNIDITDVVTSILFFSNQVLTPDVLATADLAGCGPDGRLTIVDVVQEIAIFTTFHGDFLLSSCPIPCP